MPDTHTEERKLHRAKIKRRKKAIKYTLISLVAILLVTVGITSVISIVKDNTYRNKEQFREYVAQCFDEIDVIRTYSPKEEEKIISYDKPLSVAMKYPVTGLEKADKAVAKRAATLNDDFYKKYDDVKKRSKILRYMNYELFQTQRDVTSIVLITEDRQKEEFEMVTKEERVYIYNYSTETGEPLNGLQIFDIGYKESFSEYLKSYFKDEYGDQLLEGYGQYLEVNNDNLNNYVLTDGGVRFYFQPGTILDKSQGIVVTEIDYSKLTGIVKKEATIRFVDPDKPMVALTYDDGPYPKVSNRILSCLSKHDAVATFFMLGENANRYPKVVKRKAQLGMEIGSHTWSHPNLYDLSKKEIKKELKKTSNAIKEACGHTPTVFRPPYGNIDKDILKVVDMPAILWSVDTLDWESRKSKSVVKVVKKIEKEDGLDGRVILMHSLYPSTAKATEILVPWLQEKGYQLVTVSELIKYRYNEEPKDGKLYGYDYFYLED